MISYTNKFYNKKIFLILILPFLQPLIFNEYIVFDDLFLIFKIVFSVVIMILYFAKIKQEKKISAPIIFIMIYELILFASTLLNNSDMIRYFSQAIPILSVCLLTEMWIKNEPFDFLKKIVTIFGMYIIINLITVMIIPWLLAKQDIQLNMQQMYFLGEDNRFIFVILPLMFYSFAYSIMKYNKISKQCWSLYFISLFTLTYVWSVAAMIVLLIMPFIYFIYLKIFVKVHKVINVWTTYIFMLLASLGLFVFKIQYMLEPLFYAIFNKKQTLESRYMLWDRGIDYISQHPLLGYGTDSIEIMQSKFIVNHPHNTILNIGYESGILGIFAFSALMITIAYSIVKNKNKCIVALSTTIILLFILLSLYDSLNHTYFFMLFISIYYINQYEV